MNNIIAAITFATLLFPTLLLAAHPRTLEGTVTKVRDGDTIVVEGVPVRLNGVAAPELRQRMGGKARTFMMRLVDDKTVTCELNGRKTHDRWVGICYRDGQDIGAAIIAAGLARDCPRYSGGRYSDDETSQSRTLPLPKYCLGR